MRKITFSLKTKFALRSAINGTFATIEHLNVIKNMNLVTLVDVGANKGQFSILARVLFPAVKIYAFEPLESAAKILGDNFKRDENINIFNTAIGSKESIGTIHISAKNDSSSLLPIGTKQVNIFPGTEEINAKRVPIKPLNSFLEVSSIRNPSILKIDVQGYELEVLKGCNDLLHAFQYILVELSFIELYGGQPVANDILIFLNNAQFHLSGVYNLIYDKAGFSVQGDFLFTNSKFGA